MSYKTCQGVLNFKEGGPQFDGHNKINIIRLEEKDISTVEEIEKQELREKFDVIRQAYRDYLKGTTRGIDTEFDNFLNRNKKADKELLERIYKSIKVMYTRELKKKEEEQFKYVPHFQTFINQKRWEEYE